MKLILADVLADLTAPGRKLAFCDESNLTEQATLELVAHLRLHAGFVVDSSVYATAAVELAAFLDTHGLPEFHATEVVNGKTDSLWKAVPMARRLDAFERVAGALELPGSRIPYLYLSRQDYAAMIAQSGNALIGDYKTTLKAVFLAWMTEYLAASPSPMLVIDRAKNTPGPVLHQVMDPAKLHGGGAISIESHHVIGLQIADMATYVVRRYLLKKAAVHQGNGSAFDEIAAKAVASFLGRFDLLPMAYPVD